MKSPKKVAAARVELGRLQNLEVQLYKAAIALPPRSPERRLALAQWQNIRHGVLDLKKYLEAAL